MEKRWIRITCIIVIIAGAIAMCLLLAKPSVPFEWKRISRGMSREQVLAIVPDQILDLRDLKSFDVATREYKIWGFRPCWWQLFVTYDQSSRVASVKISFFDPNCGWLNTRWREMK